MTGQGRFSARSGILTGQMLLAVMPVAWTICFLFFGGLGWRLAVASFVLVPVVWVLAWLMARLDQVEFDAGNRIIRRRWRKSLPFDEIESLRVLLSVGTLQVSARTHAGKSEMVLLGLPSADEGRLREAFQRCCPDAPVVRRAYSGWKLTAVAVVLMLAVYAAGMFWIRRESPVTRLACSSVDPGPAEAGELTREGEGIQVRMPASFAEARLRVLKTGRFTEAGRLGQGFLRVAGIRSEYELFRYAACAQQGLVPMVLKTALLGQWEDAEVMESVRGPHRRLAIAGTRNGVGDTSILVLNTEYDVEALIAMRLGGRITRDRLGQEIGAIIVEPADPE